MNFNEIIKRGIWMDLPDAQLLEKTAREINPKIILEIGGAIGASSMILGHIAKDNNGILYTIEQNPHHEWYENMKYFGLQENSILIKGFSPWINNDIIEEPIDYLFIDGSHETKAIIVDYCYWEPFVRKGGRIAFHDYTSYDKGTEDKVKRAINLILETDKHLKKVAEVKSKWGLIVFEKQKEKFDFKSIA